MLDKVVLAMASFRDELAARRAEWSQRGPTEIMAAGNDLLTFLSDVLPPNGPVYYAAYTAPGQSWHHIMARSVGQLADYLVSCDQRGYEVYFALAGFAESNGARRRTRENARFLRACWLDIDVGPDKEAAQKGYASVKAATDAVMEFCSRISCNPTYLIGSGAGLHCYWAFPAALDLADWDRLAKTLKLACAAGGLRIDPVRTTDAASVLRPIGARNRKNPTNPRVVHIVEKGSAVDPKHFFAELTALAGTAEPHESHPHAVTTLGHFSLRDWLHTLPEHAQLSLLDEVCSAIPDSAWCSYETWTAIMAALGGIRGVRETAVIDLLVRHSARSPKWVADGWTHERLRAKFLTFKGGSITGLFALAEKYGWSPRRRNRTIPYEAHERAEAEEYLAARFIYVKSQHLYVDAVTKELIIPAALDESQFHLTQLICKSPRQLLKASPRAQRVSGLGYHPGAGVIYEEDGRMVANLYAHWAPDEIHPTREELDLWDWFINGQLFAGPADKTARDYFLDAIAYPLQHPGDRVASVPLLIGLEGGTGKSTLTEIVPRLLFGHRNVSTATQAEIESSFNDWQTGSQILCLPEIWIGGHRDAEKLANRLKDSVTSPVLRVHPKGLKGYSQPNRTTILATSNHENAVALSDGDRRWGIHVTSANKMPVGDARRLYDLLDGPRGPGVLRHIFMARDLSNFNPRGEPPLTEGKRLVIAASRSDAETAILDAWTNRDFPFDRDLVVLEDIREVLAAQGVDAGLRKIGDFLRRAPISATRLPLRPRVHATRQGAGGLPFRRYDRRTMVWAVRNANVWNSATESVISRHFSDGTPPVAHVTPPQCPVSPASKTSQQACSKTDAA
jgi:hypothetical protein